MKNITVSVPNEVAAEARVAAAREGKSLSRFVSDLLTKRVGRKMTQREAIDAFLAGPLLNLTDENGNAPTRDMIYERDRG